MLRILPLCLLGAFALLASCAGRPANNTLLIAGGLVIDGTGAPARSADVRVRGDRIVAIGQFAPFANETVLDAHGYGVAPGFIDCHSHLDRTIAAAPLAQPAITQGVTTLVFGADGFSHSPLGDFFAEIERVQPAVNVASFSGHNTLRTRSGAQTRRSVTDREMAAMQAELTEDMANGAIGLSTGLGYEPGVFADLDELARLNQTAARGGLYSSHIRNESALVAERSKKRWRLAGAREALSILAISRSP